MKNYDTWSLALDLARMQSAVIIVTIKETITKSEMILLSGPNNVRYIPGSASLHEKLVLVS